MIRPTVSHLKRNRCLPDSFLTGKYPVFLQEISRTLIFHLFLLSTTLHINADPQALPNGMNRHKSLSHQSEFCVRITIRFVWCCFVYKTVLERFFAKFSSSEDFKMWKLCCSDLTPGHFSPGSISHFTRIDFPLLGQTCFPLMNGWIHLQSADIWLLYWAPWKCIVFTLLCKHLIVPPSPSVCSWPLHLRSLSQLHTVAGSLLFSEKNIYFYCLLCLVGPSHSVGNYGQKCSRFCLAVCYGMCWYFFDHLLFWIVLHFRIPDGQVLLRKLHLVFPMFRLTRLIADAFE